MQTYTFTFTLDQVNELVACMQAGPFGQVSKCLTEIKRQMDAQQVKPGDRDTAPQPAPPGNGGQPLTS